VQYHCETGGYDATCERDERAAVNPNNRKVYRYQIQGPDALKVLEKLNGGPLPETRFFNMDWITIAGRQVRALHHGMSGVPGREIFGPWDDGAAIKAALLEAGAEFGLIHVGSRVYATNTLESGWIPCPLPAVFSGDDMKTYREWLPAKGYEGTGSLGGSYYSDDIADYYFTPYDLGYGPFVKFDHDFIGRTAVEAEIAAGGPKRKLMMFVVEPDPDSPADVIGDEPIWHSDNVVGWITSGGYAHYSGTSLAWGYIPTDLAQPATTGFEIEIIGNRRPARLQLEPVLDPAGTRMRA
jgi:vanillate/3-O-methylgallate O-demethylase